MAIIKCKMCGGDITLAEDKTYGTCEYCGSTMTFPKVSDEQKLNLFNRANHFRRQNEFDKAIAAYEKILDQDDTDAEAHWGAVLSRYGIEYVEDTLTHRRTPTCHRIQKASVLADPDYKAAIAYAPDEETAQLYRDEAHHIAQIQKAILEISSKEQPYDVFICYKEEDENGQRTKDSVFAQEIYYRLTDEGYRVFFSRITLEDKLGEAYEPYIFAALNSARVMLVIATRPEYINAVWVRNEWSRFLALSRNDRNRLLIPCYRDMEPYDLPEELSLYQSQDMGKIGFIQDLIRGIKKVIPIGNDPNAVLGNSTPGVNTTASIIDQLDKLHQLYQQGVIDDSVYNKQKVTLIHSLKQEHGGQVDEEQDTGIEEVADLTIYIKRDKARVEGEEATYVFVDGEIGSAVDDNMDMTLPFGIHFIWFQRGIHTSNTVTIEPQQGKRYDVALFTANQNLEVKLAEAQYNQRIQKNSMNRIPSKESQRTMAPKAQPETAKYSSEDKHALELLDRAEQKELQRYREELRDINHEIDSVNVEYSKQRKGQQKKAKAEFDDKIYGLNLRLEGLKEKARSTEAKYNMIRNDPSELRKWVDNFMATEVRYQEAQGLMDHGEFLRARDIYRSLNGLYDSYSKAEECDRLYKEGRYNDAVSLQGQRHWQEALALYKELGAYKDCVLRADQCKKKLGNKGIMPASEESDTKPENASKTNGLNLTKKGGFSKALKNFIVIVIILSIIYAVGFRLPSNQAKQASKKVAEQPSAEYPNLVAPSAEYIISRLARVQSIVAIGVATEDHDPNHQIGKEGGYITAVFFSSTLVDENAASKSEYEVISDGTDGGGCIEVFRTVEDAIKRESYLSMFNGAVINSGSHKVLGTCVIRTTSKLSSGLQATLENAIVKAFTEDDFES